MSFAGKREIIGTDAEAGARGTGPDRLSNMIAADAPQVAR